MNPDDHLKYLIKVTVQTLHFIFYFSKVDLYNIGLTRENS